MSAKQIPFRDATGRKKKIEILFEDESLIAVNKPSGMPVIPDRWDDRLPNLRDLLERYYQKITETAEQAIWVVHRIDADTSGIILFARTAEMHRALNTMFEAQEIDKTYLALTAGGLKEKSGVISLPIRRHPKRRQYMQVNVNGKSSETHFQIAEEFRQYCLVELVPKTGRTHQIRVHLAALNCPLAIDPLYGSSAPISLENIKPRFRKNNAEKESALMQRLTLHAAKLSFQDPITNARRIFEAPLPKDFAALLKALRKWG